jgi:hypothetical protein
MDAVARVAGSYSYDWDGRNSSSKILPETAMASCSVAAILRENHVVTTGDAINITDLKTDPYDMSLSFGNLTRIKYSINRAAMITITATSPLGSVVTVLNSQLQTAGDHEREWTAVSQADSTGKQFAVSEEGDYMIVVQAANLSTGTVSTRRGYLKVRY